jgi:hypothetical protein
VLPEIVIAGEARHRLVQGAAKNLVAGVINLASGDVSLRST